MISKPRDSKQVTARHITLRSRFMKKWRRSKLSRQRERSLTKKKRWFQKVRRMEIRKQVLNQVKRRKRMRIRKTKRTSLWMKMRAMGQAEMISMTMIRMLVAHSNETYELYFIFVRMPTLLSNEI